MGKKRRGMGVHTGRFGGAQPWEMPGGRPKVAESPSGWEVEIPSVPEVTLGHADAFIRQMQRMMEASLGIGETSAANLPVTEEGHVELIRGRRHIEGGNITYTFDSFADMVDQAEHRWRSGFHNGNMKNSKDTGAGDWAGTLR